MFLCMMPPGKQSSTLVRTNTRGDSSVADSSVSSYSPCNFNKSLGCPTCLCFLQSSSNLFHQTELMGGGTRTAPTTQLRLVPLLAWAGGGCILHSVSDRKCCQQ